MPGHRVQRESEEATDLTGAAASAFGAPIDNEKRFYTPFSGSKTLAQV